MKIFITSIVVLCAVLVLHHLIVGMLKPRGTALRVWKMDGKIVEFPFGEYVNHPVWRTLKTKFLHPGGRVWLVFPMPGVHSLKFILNGDVVLEYGSEERAVNAWTSTFTAPVELASGENVAEIKMRSLYKYTMRFPPYFVERLGLRESARDLFFKNFPVFTSGSLLILGLILLILSFKLSFHVLYSVFGLIFVVEAFWLMNFWFISFPNEMFLIYKKILYALTFFIGGMYNYAVELLVRRYKTHKFTNPVTLGVVSFAILHPNFWFVRKVLGYLGPVFFTFMFYDTYLIARFGNMWLYSAFLFFVLSSLGYAMTFSALVPNITVVYVSFFYFALVFSIYLVGEFGKTFEEMRKERMRAMTDPLTGAYNRRALEELNVDEKDCLVFFDLDDFKKLNDEMGHEYGDVVLKRFVQIVKDNIRSEDHLIRYGGDEFVLILKGCGKKEARKIASRIAENFEDVVGVGVSYGISTLENGLNSAIKFADKKMYEKKERKKERKKGRKEERTSNNPQMRKSSGGSGGNKRKKRKKG